MQDAKKKKKRRRKKVKPLHSFIVAFAFTCLLIYLSIAAVGAYIKISEVNDKISVAKTKYEDISDQNGETKKLLENADEKEIVERIARERLGYVFPDEKVYYDVN